MAAEEKIHPSRRRNVHSSHGSKPKKSTKKSKSLAHQETATIGSIRNEIRNLTRLLERDVGLPAHVRIEKERALASYNLDLEEAKEAKRAKEVLSKYHMVRFFGQ